MAMRLFPAGEFEKQLSDRGCSKTERTIENVGTVWETPDGKSFIVPEPEGGYPDWMLDHLIQTMDIPAAPAPPEE